MNYDHENLLADFAKRTRHNLQLIRDIQATEPEKQAFEVTQLINSMLGLLVFPKEHYLDSIPDKSLDELKGEGWPIPEVHAGFTEARNLKDFLRLMRNAIAHFNVEFVADRRNQIVGVKVWNTNRNDVKTWETDLTLEQMEFISLRFIGLLTGEDDINMSNSQQSPIQWRRAFIRSGFNPIEVNGKFDFNQENYQIQQFLTSLLAEIGQRESYKDGVFSPISPTIEEQIWLAAIDKLHTDSEGGQSGMDDIELQLMDTYMAGIVRWVNAAGIRTTHSCDGHSPHERRGPILDLADVSKKVPLNYFLRLVSDGEWIFRGRSSLCKNSDLRRSRDGEQVNSDRSWLLDVAEAIHQHQASLRQLVEISEKLARS